MSLGHSFFATLSFRVWFYWRLLLLQYLGLWQNALSILFLLSIFEFLVKSASSFSVHFYSVLFVNICLIRSFFSERLVRIFAMHCINTRQDVRCFSENGVLNSNTTLFFSNWFHSVYTRFVSQSGPLFEKKLRLFFSCFISGSMEFFHSYTKSVWCFLLSPLATTLISSNSIGVCFSNNRWVFFLAYFVDVKETVDSSFETVVSVFVSPNYHKIVLTFCFIGQFRLTMCMFMTFSRYHSNFNLYACKFSRHLMS